MLGGAACVWEDLAALRAMVEPETVIAVNYAGVEHEGRIDHWATLHPENLEHWRKRREGNADFVTWSHRDGHLVDRTTDHWKGSSGLYGARVALALGYTRVVLCGVPLDERPHFHDSDRWAKGSWRDAGLHRKELDASLQRYRGPVRSMSGYTAQVLGTPTEEWLHGEAEAA